jgi:outer membrane protein TolC
MIQVKKSPFVVGALLLLGQSLSAQSTDLSLEEALSQAQVNNNEIKIKQQEVTVAQYNYQKTNSVFLPKITLSEVGIQTDDPLYAFGFLLQQRQVEVADFHPEILNEPGNSVNWQTQIAVEQPLINVDGFYGRKAANCQVQAYGKAAERTTQYIQFHVKEAYFGLQLAKQQKGVIQQAFKATEEAFRMTQNQFGEGYVQQADLLKVKVRLLELENQLAEADNNIENANNQLSYLITGKIGSEYNITDSLVIDNFSTDEILTVSTDHADIQALLLTNQAYKFQMKMNKSKFIPRLNAFGQYNLNDTKALVMVQTVIWLAFH